MTEPVGPVSNWHPLAKVRIQIRVEDFSDDSPSEVVVQPNTGSEAFGLGQEHQAGLQYKSVGFDIVPYSFNFERNSYRKADEIRVTIPTKALPFDPRLLRSATIQVFAGTVDPLTYAQAMDGPDAPGLLIPDANADGESNEVFRGFVDDWDMDLEEHDTIDITARDLTQFFIDAELPQTALKGIPKTTPLDQVIILMLFGDGLPEAASKRPGLPGVKGVQVVNEVGTLPQLGQIKPPNWFDSKKTVKKGRKRSKRNVQKMSYWDMMTDLCIAAGFIIYVRPGQKPVTTPAGKSFIPPAEVVISNPRTYYKKSTSFGDEVVPAEEVRQFVVGLNVDRARIRRNYAGTSIPTTIEVRTFDTGTGQEFSSRFPKKKKNNRPATSGRGDREEVAVYVVRSQGGEGVQERLDAMAESIYEQLARGELELRIETKAMAFLPSNMNPRIAPQKRGGLPVPPDADPDIFRLIPSDPIALVIDKGDFESERVKEAIILEAATAEGARELLVKAGIRPDIAGSIAAAAKSQNLQREFRTQKVTIQYNHNSGFAFEIEAINYIDVRNAVENGG